MCNFVSLIVTKHRIYFGVTDSHESIIEQHDLHEGGGRINFVRVELFYLGDELQWRVDQCLLPEWWDGDEYERRCRAAVKASGIIAVYDDYWSKIMLIDDAHRAKHSPLIVDYIHSNLTYNDYRSRLALLEDDFDAKHKLLEYDYNAKRQVISDTVY